MIGPRIKAIVDYHLLLGGLAVLATVIVGGIGAWRGEGWREGLLPALLALAFLSLGAGLHQRIEWVRRLELVLVPCVAAGLTVAVVAGMAARDRPRALLVTALFWVKTVYLVRTLTRPQARAEFARRDRPPLLDLLRGVREGVRDALLTALLGLVLVGLIAGFVGLRLHLVPGASSDPLQLAGTVVGGFLCALVVLFGGAVALGTRRGGGDLERVDPAARERIFAMRDEGRALRGIARALLDEGHRPPYGERWPTRVVKEVLLTHPVRPTAP